MPTILAASSSTGAAMIAWRSNSPTRRGGQIVGQDGSRRAGHDGIGSQLQVVTNPLHEARQVALR